MPLILVIEDNESLSEMLKDLLNRKHYDVKIASNGKDGLRMALQINPDLILLDVCLPKLNGYEICRRLKAGKDSRLIPIVMLTGIWSKKEKIKGLKAGADDFLQKPVDYEELVIRIRSLIKVKQLNKELENVDNILTALISIIDAKDSYTGKHSDRVKKTSVLIADKLSFTKEQISRIKKAADLHDIGKIGISDQILNKKGPLTDKEFEIIKQHPCIGETLCTPLKSLSSILKIIRHHHERYDGTGYPDALEGEDIPIEARVIAVADSYDAMSLDRPYRQKLTIKKIISELSAGKGIQWDEKVVNCLLELITGKQLCNKPKIRG